MIVKNIDSSLKVQAEVWQALEKRLTFLREKLEKIPIYLVSADTMLGIRSATYLDPSQVRDYPLPSFSPTDIEKALKTCRVRTSTPQLACYVEDTSTIAPLPSKKLSQKKGPAIFVSPEVCFIHGELIFQYALLRALLEYFGKTKPDEIERVIQQSLHTAIAWMHFTPQERPFVADFIANWQSLEETSYVFWIDWLTHAERTLATFFLSFLYEITLEWKDLPPKLNLVDKFISETKYSFDPTDPNQHWLIYFFAMPFGLLRMTYENLNFISLLTFIAWGTQGYKTGNDSPSDTKEALAVLAWDLVQLVA